MIDTLNNNLFTMETNKINANSNNLNNKQLNEATNNFQGVFLNQLLKKMFGEVGTDSMFNDSHATKIWQSMLIEQYSNNIKQHDVLKINHHINKSLKEKQIKQYEQLQQTNNTN